MDEHSCCTNEFESYNIFLLIRSLPSIIHIINTLFKYVIVNLSSFFEYHNIGQLGPKVLYFTELLRKGDTARIKFVICNILPI